MTLAEISDTLINKVMLKVSGCQAVFAEYQLKETVKDFISRTDAWQDDISVDLIEEQSEYDLEVPDGSRAEKILGVKVGSRIFPDRAYSLSPEGVIIIHPPFIPRESASMEVRLSLYPDGDSFPEWILSRYSEGLAGGAASRLLKLPRRPWTDLQSAIFEEREYLKVVTEELSRASCRGTTENRGIGG